MTWRKWVVRSLVFVIAGAIVCAAIFYQHWTNPGAVREQVLAKLHTMFPGAVVTIDSARLRLLGGIALNDLRLTRRDDSDRTELLHVPSLVLYHDKEKLMDGGLVFRKVELHRPRLRLVRNREGHWNIEGLSGAAQPNQPLPTLVVHQGTFVLDDRVGGSGPVEINNVNLTLVNDPLPQVTIDGTAKASLGGSLRVRGQWDRESREVALALTAADVPLSTELVQRLNSSCPNSSLSGLQLEARANVQVELGIRPGSPLHYDLHCQVRDGKIAHPQLPVPLENVEAILHCAAGQVRVEQLKARSGAATVAARGWALLPCVDRDFEAVVEIKHLELNDQLCDRLPEKLHSLGKLYKAFRPVGAKTLGSSTVRLECARRDGKWAPLTSGAPSRARLIPETMSVSFVDRFDYQLDRLSGFVEQDLLQSTLQVDAIGHAGDRPVFIKGSWRGVGRDVDATFDIHAADIPLDDKLLHGLHKLPESLQKLARSFHAQGKADFQAHVRHAPGAETFTNDYHVRFHDASVCWDEFAYPLEHVSGHLDIYPGHWEFRDGRGKHNGGEVAVQCRSKPAGDGVGGAARAAVLVEINGRNMGLDAALRKALEKMPALAKAWDTFRPAGHMTFSARIDHPLLPAGLPREEGPPKDLEIGLEVDGCTIEPTFFPYGLHDLSGSVHYYENRLELSRLNARHGNSLVSLEHGTVDLRPGGGFFADLKELRGHPMYADDDLLAALPASLRATMRAIQVRDPVNLNTRLVVAMAGDTGSQPDIYWDGHLRVQDARLQTGIDWTDVTGRLACRGRYQGQKFLGLLGNLELDRVTLLKQPFRDVHARLVVKEKTPDVLNVDIIRAPLFEGDVAGQVRVEFGSNLRYELNLTASQIDLQEFGKHNLGPNPQVKGMMAARLHLTGLGSGVDTLDGNGSLDVPNGSHLLNLPLLLDLLKFLGLRWPDRTMFEEAHALFTIRGRRVTVRDLDLYGNAVSLSGKGSFNLDGTDLQLDFYPSWARVEQLLPPAARPLPHSFSKNLLKIEMRGKVGSNPNDLKFTKKPVPILLDPLLYMRDLMVGKNTEPAQR